MLAIVLALALLQTAAPEQTIPQEPAMPKHFVIGSEKWLLLRVHSLGVGEDGRTNCKTRSVMVVENLKPRAEAETIMHEIMHALGCREGYPHDEIWNNSNDPSDDNGDEGHAGIYQMAPRLVDFFVDNPELIKYLQEQGRQH